MEQLTQLVSPQSCGVTDGVALQELQSEEVDLRSLISAVTARPFSLDMWQMAYDTKSSDSDVCRSEGAAELAEDNLSP